MSLNSNALVSIKYLKLALGIDESDTKYDNNRLEQFINQASGLIETECHRKFITPSADLEEIFDGDSTKDYYVKNARIAATPTLYYWQGSAWVQDTSSSFTYVEKTGRVYFTDGNIFSSGSDNWKINYKYGWTLKELPEDVKIACSYRVKYLMEMMRKGGISSESFGDTTTTFKMNELLKLSQSLLKRYKRLSVG